MMKGVYRFNFASNILLSLVHKAATLDTKNYRLIFLLFGMPQPGNMLVVFCSWY